MSDFLMDTYKRTGIVLERGRGARVWDAAGKEYVDFASGIGVSSLGHAHPALVAAISEQAARMIHCSNYYQTEVAQAFAAELCGAAGMDKAFLCNSGAEANEGAIKLARKYGESLSPARSGIVTLAGSFHGRTIATLRATGQDKFHEHFGPFPEGFSHVPANDLPALEAALGPGTCALMLEPLQGEGGVVPLSPEYLRGAARLCAERGILLVADEVQCGVGRTGTFLASSGCGVAPDVATLAKGLAGGVPVGALLARGKAALVLGPGEHGSTFGGNPLAAAAGRAVLAELGKPGFLARVAAAGERVASGIRAMRHPALREVRGRGLMLGVAVDVSPDAVKAAAGKRGLLVLTAGTDVVRLLPPLVIRDEDIDRGLELLRASLDDAAS